MIRINLLPHKKFKPVEKGVLKLRVLVVLATLLVLVGLGVLFFNTKSSLEELTVKNQQTETQLANLKKKIKEVEGYEKKRLEFQSNLDTINRLDERKVSLTLYLNEINRLMTKSVWLETLAVSGPDIKLTGRGLGSNGIDEFVNRLKQSGLFTDLASETGGALAALKAGLVGNDSKDEVKGYPFTVAARLAGYKSEPAPAEQPAPAAKKGGKKKGKK